MMQNSLAGLRLHCNLALHADLLHSLTHLPVCCYIIHIHRHILKNTIYTNEQQLHFGLLFADAQKLRGYTSAAFLYRLYSDAFDLSHLLKVAHITFFYYAISRNLSPFLVFGHTLHDFF